MISNELLESVLNIEVKNFFISNNHICFDENGCNDELNIYELMYRCKEWANKSKHFIVSSYNNNGLSDMSGKSKIKWYYSDFGEDRGEEMGESAYFYSNTEYEAVFKACEYLLKNKI